MNSHGSYLLCCILYNSYGVHAVCDHLRVLSPLELRRRHGRFRAVSAWLDALDQERGVTRVGQPDSVVPGLAARLHRGRKGSTKRQVLVIVDDPFGLIRAAQTVAVEVRGQRFSEQRFQWTLGSNIGTEGTNGSGR